ncbi:hypothetical protein KP509_37G064900 [Ceratopteris richardii]|uniref:Uncharacterized protein n=1 Tax=Ceratopteris richardii TaxID=49495 RepID=A0A8T2Q8J3_CERRI|nr:hypothetical protein KP509_37G064900 [Ceratopteris richardii]
MSSDKICVQVPEISYLHALEAYVQHCGCESLCKYAESTHFSPCLQKSRFVFRSQKYLIYMLQKLMCSIVDVNLFVSMRNQLILVHEIVWLVCMIPDVSHWFLSLFGK